MIIKKNNNYPRNSRRPNYTIFLGISSEGDVLMVKEGFFNQYSTHYFFKSFLERVLIKDENWAWKNTITLDNSKVQKNVY